MEAFFFQKLVSGENSDALVNEWIEQYQGDEQAKRMLHGLAGLKADIQYSAVLSRLKSILDLNMVVGEGGQTAAMRAAKYGSFQMLEALLNRGVH